MVEKTVLLLEPVSFSGIEERKLRKPECTLKTAQPDGKHLVKKPVAKLWKQSMRAEMRQFCSWSQENKTDKDCGSNPLTATQISDDQVTKGAGWMPWHWTPKKDVVSCEKPRGAASRL